MSTSTADRETQRVAEFLQRLNNLYEPPVTRARLLNAIAEGAVVAKRDHTGNRFLVDIAEMPRAVAYFGMTIKSAVPEVLPEAAREEAGTA